MSENLDRNIEKLLKRAPESQAPRPGLDPGSPAPICPQTEKWTPA